MKIVLEGEFDEVLADIESLYNKFCGVRVSGLSTELKAEEEKITPPAPRTFEEAAGIQPRPSSFPQIHDEASAVQVSATPVEKQYGTPPTAVVTENKAVIESAAPQPTAPVVPTPAKVEKDTNAELDSAGNPWDASIHASTKTKMANGEWKKKPRRGGATKTPTPKAAPKTSTPTTNDILSKVNELIAKGIIDYGDILDIVKDFGYNQIIEIPNERVQEFIALLESYEAESK